MRPWLVVLAGCSSTPAPVKPIPAPPQPAGDPLVITKEDAQPRRPDPPPALPGTTSVVITSSGASSRSPESPRLLRQLIAARQGKIEFATGYPRVGLAVTGIVSGTLEDPSYDKRPVGTNHLGVVLLDEAAFATNDSLDGFKGTWKLTRTATGTLFVSAIGDTPYDPGLAVKRDALLAKARAGLRGTPAQRIAALDILEQHPFLELVPDAIPLLDDTRTVDGNAKPRPPSSRRLDFRKGPRVVSKVASSVLHKIVQPFAGGRAPADNDVAAWSAYWRTVLAGDTSTEKTLAPAATTILEITMNQSWPEIVALPDGAFAMSVSRLVTPIDNHTDGLVLSWPPYAQRLWVDKTSREEVDVAAGIGGTYGVLSADTNDSWRFSVVKSTATKLPAGQPAFAAKHAAIASNGRDYLAIYIVEGDRSLFAQPIDIEGRMRGKPTKIPLPEEPAAWYHRGFHALELVRRTGGWLAAVETRGGVLAVSLDDKLALAAPPAKLASSSDFTQPKLAMGSDRAFVAWTQGRHDTDSHVGVAVIRADGTTIAKSATTGSEVWDVSRPIVLADGGFAVSWIEAEDELHVGRWTAAGQLVGTALVARGAGFLTITLGRDASGLLVGYQDVARYPFRLVALHVDPAQL